MGSSAETPKLPPGPCSWPIVGNAHLMTSESRLADFMEMEKKYGNVFRLYLGKQLAIIVSGRDAIKEAFLTKAADFAGRPILYSTEVFTNGGSAYSVATEDYNPRWNLLRAITISAYKMYTIDVRKQAEVYNDEFDRLLQRVQAKNGEPYNIKSDILAAAINAFCVMMLGSRYELDDPEFIRLAEIESGIFMMFTEGFLVDVFPCLKFFPFKSIRAVKELSDDRDKILGRIYREHVEANRVQNPQDLTDALITATKEAEEEDPSNKGMVTDQHFIMLMNEIFIASVVNFTNTLAWGLLYLVHNPSIQDLVHQELDHVVGPDRLPDIGDKQSLPFLEATINETMRLASVIPLSVPRKTTVDTSLLGYHIPKDTTVFTNLWSLHHDPDFWDAPNEFRPQRFLDKDGKFVPPNPEHFFPFGVGIRNCVGESMSRIETYLVLARLLHSFKFETPPGCDMPSLEPAHQGFALGPKPFKLCAIKRHDV